MLTRPESALVFAFLVGVLFNSQKFSLKMGLGSNESKFPNKMDPIHLFPVTTDLGIDLDRQFATDSS